MFEKVKAIIANELGVDENKITPESKLSEDLGADSLDAVELIMAIEDELKLMMKLLKRFIVFKILLTTLKKPQSKRGL